MAGPSSNNCCEKFLKYVSPLNYNHGIPDQKPRCTWHLGADPKTSPHSKVDWKTLHKDKRLSDITKAVGNTPLVRLNKIPKSAGIQGDVFAKCEFFNPGGSIKDRIGIRMIEDAENNGLLKPGYTIIEPTSGNTGIGLALGAAVKGYRCIIVISEKMSNEKVDVLRALGAEIVRTPLNATSGDPDGQFGVCHRLRNEIPNSIILDQYSNPGNPIAHYDTTAEEIFDHCDGKIDILIIGAGTGGTITGIGKKIKEISPETVIVGVDPEGSILAQPDEINKSDVTFYEVEGIGYDFIPTGIDRNIVDRWVKVNDKESLNMARRLIKEEGLLCGGSSGAAVAGALKVLHDLKPGQKAVVILPDSIRNYLTKFVSDQWMEARGLLPTVNLNKHWWWDEVVANFELQPLTSATLTTTCERALILMKKQGIDQLPVVDKNGGIMSCVTMQKLLSAIVTGNLQNEETIQKATIPVFPKVGKNDILGLVSRILEKEAFVVVVDEIKTGSTVIEKPLGLITAVDVLSFISNNDPNLAKVK